MVIIIIMMIIIIIIIILILIIVIIIIILLLIIIILILIIIIIIIIMAVRQQYLLVADTLHPCKKCYIIAKLDFTNTFNFIHRDAMLDAWFNKLPEIFSFCNLACRGVSIPKFRNQII